MRKLLTRCLLPAVAAILGVSSISQSADKTEPQLAHMVFFTLKDHSKEAREKFVVSCDKHLSGHDRTVYFSVGSVAEDVEETVSVKDFDVALHVVFENKDAKAKYLEHPRHKQFVEENRDFFAKVRVFDSYLTTSKR